MSEYYSRRDERLDGRYEGRIDGLDMAADLAKAVILMHESEEGICHGAALIIAAISRTQKKIQEEHVKPKPERKQISNPPSGEPGGYPG